MFCKFLVSLGQRHSNCFKIKMRLFQTFKKINTVLTIRSDMFEVKQVLPVFCFAYALIFATIYLFVEAESFEEYLKSFYPFITLLANLSSPLSLYFIGDDILNLIDHFEEVINARKTIISTSYYDKR